MTVPPQAARSMLLLAGGRAIRFWSGLAEQGVAAGRALDSRCWAAGRRSRDVVDARRWWQSMACAGVDAGSPACRGQALSARQSVADCRGSDAVGSARPVGDRALGPTAEPGHTGEHWDPSCPGSCTVGLVRDVQGLGYRGPGARAGPLGPWWAVGGPCRA